ncbi:MAG: hypothetical protein ABR573_03085 [Candidatus Dormibacteria bacterium]
MGLLFGAFTNSPGAADSDPVALWTGVTAYLAAGGLWAVRRRLIRRDRNTRMAYGATP